jgi:hypothetical protein|tara:strand:+ start:491 stop:832 length:342 start_codon:yes stop_codon:yes gene_type:complete
MATTKTKGTNSKIKELKGIKPEKITDDELTQLQSTVRTIDRITIDIGRLEVQKHGLMVGMQKTQEGIESIRKDFLATYGTDNVNIQTGDIAYAEETPETTQTPEIIENGEVNS